MTSAVGHAAERPTEMAEYRVEVWHDQVWSVTHATAGREEADTLARLLTEVMRWPAHLVRVVEVRANHAGDRDQT